MDTTSENGLIFGKIEMGKRYSLKLTSDEQQTFSLQYSFQPANVDPLKVGKLLLASNDEATVELQRNDDTIESFRGTSSSATISGQDQECLLVFEDGQFKIRKIDTSVLNLRPVRAEGTFTGLNSSKAVSEARNLPRLLKKVGDKIKNKKKAAQEALQAAAAAQEVALHAEIAAQFVGVQETDAGSRDIVQPTDLNAATPTATSTTVHEVSDPVDTANETISEAQPSVTVVAPVAKSKQPVKKAKNTVVSKVVPVAPKPKPWVKTS